MVLLVKNPPTGGSLTGNVRDIDSICRSGRFPGGGHGNPTQYSCLENPMDRGAGWGTVHGVTKELDMTEHICIMF